jgi:hypothetical protein
MMQLSNLIENLLEVKESFIGRFFFNLIMPITKLKRKIAPIKIEQSTLNKFFPNLPKPTEDSLPAQIDKRMAFLKEDQYTLRMSRDGTVCIKETHCLTCGKRLVKNGRNPRIVIFDNGLGKQQFRLHRKRCKKCGEITPDYSKLAPKNSNFDENFKRRARQHYMEGLMPSQIKSVFKIDFGIDISKSSIVNWVNEVAEPLREVLEETPVPSSGYWGYDEIHMKVKGKKKYAINTVDMNTRFIPVARIKPKMGKKAGREVLVEGRRNATLPINGLVKDCTANLGALFTTRSFKHIELQNCLTHVKWIVSKHVKAFAGLSKQSRKPLPKKWLWLLYRFYALIDSKYEADAYIQLEAIRKTVEDLKGKDIKELQTAVNQLESWLPKIIAHQRNPSLPMTNNVTEGFHKKYEYYRSFKTQMMTVKGAQRVLDYRVFGHNSKQFPVYITQQEFNYERWRILVRNSKGDAILRGQGNYFRSMFKKLTKWQGEYQQLWEDYFAIKKD